MAKKWVDLSEVIFACHNLGAIYVSTHTLAYLIRNILNQPKISIRIKATSEVAVSSPDVLKEYSFTALQIESRLAAKILKQIKHELALGQKPDYAY